MSVVSVQDVVTGGFCIGCGGCAAASGGAITMHVNDDGACEVDLDRSDQAAVTAPTSLCPFSDLAANETALADRFFGDTTIADPRIGRYSTIHAGRIMDEERITGSSSGGLTGWLVEKLLDERLVDGVIHVGPAEEGTTGRLFRYRISYSATDARNRRKSIYYSVDMSDVLRQILNDGKHYALVGVPCFIKAVRLLMRGNPALDSQLKFLIGLVCGHLKTPAFAECLGWQAGVPPRALERFDFRLKNPKEPANRYSYAALQRSDAEWHSRPTNEALSGDWGHGMFQMNACDYCDDIFAEGADICFGDAWLPRYDQDWRGTNIVISRNRTLDRLIAESVARREIDLEPISADDAAASQGGNFRHRWDGLSVRLADAVAAGRPVPIKRIAPGSRPASLLRKMIIRLRQRMGQTSHRAFREAVARDDFAYFSNRMIPMVERMRRIYRIEKTIRRRKWLLPIAASLGIVKDG